MSKWRLKHSRI